MALVTFADDDEAIRCDRRIIELRNELRLDPSYEFHFSKNAKRIREAFLQAGQNKDCLLAFGARIPVKGTVRSQPVYV